MLSSGQTGTYASKALGVTSLPATLQKFRFILDRVIELPACHYATIQDETHSSAHGPSSRKIKEILATKYLEEAEMMERGADDETDAGDEIRKSVQARGKQANLSFFAFPATLKKKCC